jgi:hypothetical protein
MLKFFREDRYKAGFTLAHSLYLSLVTPARLIQRREELEMVKGRPVTAH